MKRRSLLSLALGLLIATTASIHAYAHQGNPDFRSEVTGFVPPIAGLRAEVLNYDSDIVLTNDSDRTVEVEGYEGEAYLRFRPDGTVEANLNSPAYYLNTDRYGDVDVPANADADADPDWDVVAATGEFSWHDHRSHYMSTSTPPQVTDEGRRTKIFDYEIPLRVDGRPAMLEGTLYWVGSSGFPLLPFVLLGIFAAGSVLLVIVVRRRRRGSDPGPRPATPA